MLENLPKEKQKALAQQILNILKNADTRAKNKHKDSSTRKEEEHERKNRF